MTMRVLGLATMGSSAAALIEDGKVIFASEEERFSRIKNDGSFPIKTIRALLSRSQITLSDVDLICVYWERSRIYRRVLGVLRLLFRHPDRFRSKFSRLKNVFLWSTAKESKYIQNQGSWSELFAIRRILKKEFGEFSADIVFLNHHLCHIASIFDLSELRDSLVLSYDGGGEELSTLLVYKDDTIVQELLSEKWPNSLGHLYSVFTGFLGFKMLEDEYKVMGLAALGQPIYKDIIRSNILNIREDGRYTLNTSLIDYHEALHKKFPQKLIQLLGPERKKGEELTKRHMDIASSVQTVFEDAVENMILFARKKYPQVSSLCLVGGCALNVSVNGKIAELPGINSIFIPPAPHDAGCAIGAAVLGYKGRQGSQQSISMEGPYLGQDFSCDEIRRSFLDLGLELPKEYSEIELLTFVAEKLAGGCIVAWYQGRSEFGPRALGNRSILADPRNDNIQELMNRKIKNREQFRPFAPSVIEEHAKEYFELNSPSPYMNIVARVRPAMRAVIPAVTHVDGTARIHTVSKFANLKYWKLINEFKRLTGVAVLLNTSFNIEEPIINTPGEAINTFLRSEIDFLIIDNLVLDEAWREQS